MNGVLLGFEIAAGMALFVLVFLLLPRRLWMPLRAQYYLRSEQPPPPEVRRYMLKKGIEKLKRSNLPPEELEQWAKQITLAALDDKEGVFAGMHSDLLREGMAMLGRIPLDHCATCKKLIFVHEATKLGEKYYCEGCNQAMKSA